jgi:hypothetical protein
MFYDGERIMKHKVGLLNLVDYLVPSQCLKNRLFYLNMRIEQVINDLFLMVPNVFSGLANVK